MANKVDNAIESLGKKPIFSGLCATFGAAALTAWATATNSDILATIGFFAGASSPFATAALLVVACAGLARDRSKLSKAFSGAALTTTLLSGVGFLSQMGAPGWEPIVGYLYTTAGMTLAGVFNIAAHYTKNKNVKISVSTEDVDPLENEEQPVAKPDENKIEPS